MSHTPPHVPSALLRKRGISLLLASFLVVLAILACSRGTELSPEQLKGRVTPLDATSVANVEAGTPLAEVLNLPPTFVPTIVVVGTPTPDPTQQGQSAVPDEGYFVQPGDTFGSIATNFGISLDDLLAYNNMSAEDLLVVGQMILIPRTALAVGPDTKLIPDSELVYSPASARFDVVAEVNLRKGYLVGYTENDPLNGELYSGAEMVRLIAQRYSVNPRLLLAVLEYESGWVTNPNPAEETLIYPMGNPTAGREGLSRQLSWAANRLNAGYYGWLNQSVASIPFADGSALGVAPGVNAGTVAVQYYFSALRSADDWRTALAPAGFLATYERLFGSPFQYTLDPLLPPGLTAPVLTYPWQVGENWYFTGGPHGGWDAGSAWAAVDFTPETVQGCNIANEWVTSVTDGLVVRSEDGAVVLDLDRDGYEQTGWTILYLHVDQSERAAVGTNIATGDAIGHVSCEGGYSNGSHLHIARRYNGMWIAADHPQWAYHFNGWQVRSTGNEYDGWLVQGDTQIEAWNGRGEINWVPR